MFGFQELNVYFKNNTFLVGEIISAADICVFFAVSSIVNGLGASEKERLIHLSRWFNHLQSVLKARTNRSFVDFTTLQLSAFENTGEKHRIAHVRWVRH